MRISNGCQRGGHEHTTLTPQAHQLLVPFVILAVIAFVSERSHILASVISVMPFNITFGLWFVYTSNGGDAARSADFSRMVTLGLIPTTLFAAACWFGFRQSWSLGRVLVVGYAVWLAAMGLYRGIEWWLQTAR